MFKYLFKGVIIFLHEKSNFNEKFLIHNNIKELEEFDIKKLKITVLKKLADQIFCNHYMTKKFINNKNIIMVNRSGINECVEKIYHNGGQRDLLFEHFIILGNLGKIIERAILVNQVYEKKVEKNI